MQTETATDHTYNEIKPLNAKQNRSQLNPIEMISDRCCKSCQNSGGATTLDSCTCGIQQEERCDMSWVVGVCYNLQGDGTKIFGSQGSQPYPAGHVRSPPAGGDRTTFLAASTNFYSHYTNHVCAVFL